jgi:DNA-binding transcriptional regulator YhcF (GntR family)
MEDNEYVTEALELLHGPSVEIESARTTIERRDGEFREVEKPAFVKISTAFKNELPDISGDALKVWLFISLSINRNNGRANPALRTIAKGVNLAVNTVQKSIKELEGHKLLSVNRDEKHYNIYEVPEYVSANRAEPIVSNGDTTLKSVSNLKQSVSNSDESVSPSVILNQRNQIKPDNLSIENAIAIGVPVTQEMSDLEWLRDTAPKMFERALGFSKPLPWWSNKEWTAFGEWVCAEYEKSKTSFGEYNIWRAEKYVKGGISNQRIRGFPSEFYDSWDMFQMSRKPAETIEYTRLL